MSRRERPSWLSSDVVRLVGRAAIRADGAEQTLAEHGFERGGDEERLHAHVDQARDRARRVVRVQGA